MEDRPLFEHWFEIDKADRSNVYVTGKATPVIGFFTKSMTYVQLSIFDVPQRTNYFIRLQCYSDLCLSVNERDFLKSFPFVKKRLPTVPEPVAAGKATHLGDFGILGPPPPQVEVQPEEE